MKYFLDTEFIEGPQTKRLLGIPYGKTKPTIDLISIGIVSEDDREYYAISKDFNLREAWDRYQMDSYDPMGNLYSIPRKVYWIRVNVLKPIFDELAMRDRGNDLYGWFSYKNLKHLIKKYGKSNTEIAEEIQYFCDTKYHHTDNTEFYAYYADYDWVAFCWLFGRMTDLPKGFPMYCRDLKQMQDEKAVNGLITYSEGNNLFTWSLSNIKNFPGYPKEENEHNALADARWDKKLFNFLEKL